MTKDEETRVSFLGIFPKKERELMAQYSNNIVISRLESQLSKNSSCKIKEETESEGKKRKKRCNCSCCVKMKNFVSNLYKVVQSNVGLLLLLGGYASCGALLFSYLEGPQDRILRERLLEGRKSFLAGVENVYSNLSLSPEPEMVNRSERNNRSVQMEYVAELLRDYEQFYNDLPAQIIKYQKSSVMRDWSYFMSLFFCGTVMTTIGYGNVTPATEYGRVATMIFGCFGIPLCLIFLSRTGKNLTRAIKFLWNFIRRFYYTGSCRKVRRMVPLDYVRMNFFQRLNSYLKSSRTRKSWDVAQTPTFEFDKQISFQQQQQQQQIGPDNKDDDDDEMVPYEVDENFNLPPIIALLVAFFYIFLGAFIYTRWENWNYLDSFYFTFISLSTIGFGDITPDHPKFFLASFVYILLGLSLVAMVITVIMEAVNDTIAKASDSVFNFRKRIKSALPEVDLHREFRLERRMSV